MSSDVKFSKHLHFLSSFYVEHFVRNITFVDFCGNL